MLSGSPSLSSFFYGREVRHTVGSDKWESELTPRSDGQVEFSPEFAASSDNMSVPSVGVVRKVWRNKTG